MCVLVICVSSPEKRLFKSSAHFKIVVFLIVECKSSFMYFEYGALSDGEWIHKPFPILAVLSSWTVSFETKALKFDQVQCISVSL